MDLGQLRLHESLPAELLRKVRVAQRLGGLPVLRVSGIVGVLVRATEVVGEIVLQPAKRGGLGRSRALGGSSEGERHRYNPRRIVGGSVVGGRIKGRRTVGGLSK